MMLDRDGVRQAAYADGYGDALVEIGLGAPPMPIWDSRVGRIADRAVCDVVYMYYESYDRGWRDGEMDAYAERRGKEAQKCAHPHIEVVADWATCMACGRRRRGW